MPLASAVTLSSDHRQRKTPYLPGVAVAGIVAFAAVTAIIDANILFLG